MNNISYNQQILAAIANQRDEIYREVLEETGDEYYARLSARDWNPII